MNTDYPHDIMELAKIPKELRAQYRPITAKEAELLKDRTPDERAAWIKERRAASDARFAKARRKR